MANIIFAKIAAPPKRRIKIIIVPNNESECQYNLRFMITFTIISMILNARQVFDIVLYLKKIKIILAISGKNNNPSIRRPAMAKEKIL